MVIDALDRAHVIWRLRTIGGVLLDGPRESLQFVRSDDGGLTWSAPIDVASAPREGAALRTPRLIANGTTLHACWAAVGRDGPMGPEVDADIVIATSTDGEFNALSALHSLLAALRAPADKAVPTRIDALDA